MEGSRERTLSAQLPRCWRCPRCSVSHGLSTFSCGACGFERRRRIARRASPPQERGQGLLHVLTKAAIGGAVGFAAGQALGDSSQRTGGLTLLAAAMAVLPGFLRSGVLAIFRMGGLMHSGAGNRHHTHSLRPPLHLGRAHAHSVHSAQQQQQQAGPESRPAPSFVPARPRTGVQTAVGRGTSQAERSDRVALVSSLVRWLHVLEGSASDSAGRGPLATLLMAELDSLVDQLSYEELYEVFGGPPSDCGLNPEQIKALAAFEVGDSSLGAGGSNPGGSPAQGTRSRSSRAAAAAAAASAAKTRAAASLLGSCCAVCLNDYRPGDKARLLPACHHAFHADCIDPWLASKASCPVCRAAVEPCC